MLNYIKYFKSVGLPLVGLLAFFLVDPFEYGYLAAYLLTVLIYIKKDFLLNNFDFDFVLLFMFSSIYALFAFFDPDVYLQTILFFGLFPPVFYLLGKFFTTKAQTIEQLYFLLLLVGFLYSVTALASVMLNLREGGFVQFERTIPMFWTGRQRSATLMGAYFTFNMCIPAILLVKLKKYNLIFKILTGIIFVLSILCVFRLGSRTQVAISLVTVLAVLIFIIPNQSVSKNIRLIFGLIIVACIIFTYVPMDLNSDIFSTLGKRLQESDNTGSAGGRTERWSKSIHNLFIKPLGWEFKEFGYSHNLWLDVAQANGLIPFFILIVFSIRSFINTKKAILCNKKALSFNSLMLAFTVGANLLFFVEPVTEGVFSIFLVYCLFQGVINKYLFSIKNMAMSSKDITQGNN